MNIKSVPPEIGELFSTANLRRQGDKSKWRISQESGFWQAHVGRLSRYDIVLDPIHNFHEGHLARSNL